MCRLLKWFGYRSVSVVPFFTNVFSEPLARSRWYGSSRHQAFESPQLSATSIVSTPSL
jgi:hypothetical protein